MRLLSILDVALEGDGWKFHMQSRELLVSSARRNKIASKYFRVFDRTMRRLTGLGCCVLMALTIGIDGGNSGFEIGATALCRAWVR